MNKTRSIVLKTAACAMTGVFLTSTAAWAEPGGPNRHGHLPELSLTDYEYVQLEALNDVHEHTIVVDEGIEPGLFHTGLTWGSHCAECGEIIEAQQVIPMRSLDYALGFGSYGDDVLEVQQYLYDLGFLEVAPDGAYGWYTQNAVSAFQQASGLDNPDGVFGYWTLEAVRSGLTPEVPADSVGDSNSSEEPVGTEEKAESEKESLPAISADDIYAVQDILYSLGYLGVEPTGYFGELTRTALSLFQLDNGLVQTQELDRQTMDALNSYRSTDPGLASYRQLYNGSFGDDVYVMQEQLLALGYLYEEPDGIFGPNTQYAVECFQADYGLDVTGIADSETLGLLENLYYGEDIVPQEGRGSVSDEEIAQIEDAYQEIVSSNASLGQQIADYAMQWVGVTPYVDYWERIDENGEFFNSLTEGTDCSGFVHMIFDAFGIFVPTGSDAYQYDVGVHVSQEELLPGDIVVYRYGGHVGIYAGNDMLIHCSTPETGTVYTTMWYDEPTAFVRVVF